MVAGSAFSVVKTERSGFGRVGSRMAGISVALRAYHVDQHQPHNFFGTLKKLYCNNAKGWLVPRNFWFVRSTLAHMLVSVLRHIHVFFDEAYVLRGAIVAIEVYG